MQGRMFSTDHLSDKLWVIAVVSNPVRYKSRYDLYQQFKKRVEQSGAQLITVELAYGDRNFEVTETSNQRHVQLRSFEELWHKENMINIGIQHLSRISTDWQYVAWIDADTAFVRHDWVEETIHQLQHYMVVQMWENAIDLGPSGQTISTHQSFVSEYLKQGASDMPDGYYSKWHPGFAWAARREAIDHLGGLIDIGILGSGDRHMAGGLIGKVDKTYNQNVSAGYKNSLKIWQERAERFIRRDIGIVPGSLLHYWHGKKVDRQYGDRWKILVDFQYTPEWDIKRDWQGLYQLVDHGDIRSINFRDRIRAYFRSRREDSVDLQ